MIRYLPSISSRIGVYTLALLFLSVIQLSCSGGKSGHQPVDARDSVVVTIAGEEGKSVLELLQRGNRVEFESSTMGAFVTGINDVRNAGGIYWLYTINDTAVPLASDRMIVHAGDTIRWRFRKGKG